MLSSNQLDWVNPEGQQCPHNLLQPLPLIPDNRGRRVIPFSHFINNDLEYLHGGACSRKYSTSVTKTKAADYGHIKWIKDLFYGFAVNRESARDVYSKRRIIGVTELKIVEWHSYKHLDWITVRRDKLYKFKEGDYKRLRIQDIEDTLLLLVQGKLTNLTVEERFAFNVFLWMFTRSIVIQRRVEDLQLGVESYQKRLNLTKPDTYRLDLKRKETYTTYSNPRGFIYQNKDKKNRLTRIDELHKFSDGKLTDVRTALDDRLKGIGCEIENKEDYEELGKVRWRQAVRGRLQDATKDHMIYRMLILSFKRFDNNVSFEEEVVHQRLRKTLAHVLELSSCRINLRRTSITGFPAQSISSSNTIASDSPNLLVLSIGASQSRQHGRYPQWRSRFLRYVDTRPNGEALRKCILSGPYKPTTVLVHVVEATDNSPVVDEHTIVETPANMSPENKAHFLAEKEAIRLILTGIGDDIYSTVDACQTA
nr:hypothetical protein [Tanacetum cinerariifolium]